MQDALANLLEERTRIFANLTCEAGPAGGSSSLVFRVLGLGVGGLGST